MIKQGRSFLLSRMTMTVRCLLLTVLLLLCTEVRAYSRASSPNMDNPWNTERINVFPAEVRQYIARICKGPAKAQQDFATYNPQEKRWRINLEYLRCSGLIDSAR